MTDPLAAYLLSVMKREATNASRRYLSCELALMELGYWLLTRPAGYSRDKMPPCKISVECELVEEYLTYTPAFAGISGFDTTVGVYADPKVTNCA